MLYGQQLLVLLARLVMYLTLGAEFDEVLQESRSLPTLLFDQEEP